MKSNVIFQTSCPFCKSNDIFQFWNRPDDVDVMRCRNCDLGFVNKYPEDLMELYDDDYFVKNSNKPFGYQDYSDNTYNFFLWSIGMLNIIDTKGSILDIGAGNGLFLEIAKSFGFSKLDGIELNTEFAEIAKKKGFKISTKSIVDEKPSNKYDVITAFEVLEHIPELEQVINTIKDSLNKNGFFCFFVPCITDNESNYEHMFSTSLEHVFYFTEKSLRKIFKQYFGHDAIIRVIDFKNAPSSGAVGFISIDRSLNEKFVKFNELLINIEHDQMSELSEMELLGLMILYIRLVEDYENGQKIARYLFSQPGLQAYSYISSYLALNMTTDRLYNQELLGAKEYFLKQIDYKNERINELEELLIAKEDNSKI